MSQSEWPSGRQDQRPRQRARDRYRRYTICGQATRRVGASGWRERSVLYPGDAGSGLRLVYDGARAGRRSVSRQPYAPRYREPWFERELPHLPIALHLSWAGVSGTIPDAKEVGTSTASFSSTTGSGLPNKSAHPRNYRRSTFIHKVKDCFLERRIWAMIGQSTRFPPRVVDPTHDPRGQRSDRGDEPASPRVRVRPMRQSVVHGLASVPA